MDGALHMTHLGMLRMLQNIGHRLLPPRAAMAQAGVSCRQFASGGRPIRGIVFGRLIQSIGALVNWSCGGGPHLLLQAVAAAVVLLAAPT